VLPVVAAGIVATAAALPTSFARRIHRAWEPTILVLVVIYGAGFHYLVLGLPGIGYPSQMHYAPIGWRELARQLDVVERKVNRETGEPALVVGTDRYFISSEFAFYSADPQAAHRKVAGVHLFGPTALMYERWFPAKEQEGRNLILVAWKPDELMHVLIERHATRMGPIEEGSLARDGKPIRKFYYRVLYGYRSDWTKQVSRTRSGLSDGASLKVSVGGE